MRKTLALLVLLVIVSQARSDLSVAFLEKNAGDFLQSKVAADVSLDQATFMSVATALLNAPTLTDVTSQQSLKISSIVKASPFSAASSLLLLTVAGIEQGEISGASGVQVKGSEDLLDGLALLKQADSVAEQIQLDTSNMHGCGEACLEQLLMQANEELGLNASYSSAAVPLKGIWNFRAADGSKIALDLNTVSNRLLALEVASFWAAVKDNIMQTQLRRSQNPGIQLKRQILSRAFISPHMIKQEYGQDSLQYNIATGVFRHLIAASTELLQTAHDERLVTALISVEDASGAQENSLWALTAPSSPLSITRRKLLAREGDSEYLNHFIAWIAMWGSFFLLLFFALTGCHCLRSMKFKQDSLLYGKNKSD